MSEIFPLLKSRKKKKTKKLKDQFQIEDFPQDVIIIEKESRTASILARVRMRSKILGLPTCPDWRKKGRVGNLEEEEAPTEWEMEQLALDKLKLKRQQALAARHLELIGLRQQLMAESMNELTEVTNVDFMTPSQTGEIANGQLFTSNPSQTIFQRSTRRHSISLQNLVEFGQMENGRVSSASHPKTIDSNLSAEKLAELQKMRKLKNLRKELDEFKAIHLQLSQNSSEKEKFEELEENEVGEEEKDEYVERGSGELNHYQFVTKFAGGSNLSLVTLQSGNEEDNDLNQRIQKMREKELKKVRRQNMVLEYRLKNQNLARELNNDID